MNVASILAAGVGRRFGAEVSRFGDASPERDLALRFGALSGSGFSLGFCFSAEASSDFGFAFFFPMATASAAAMRWLLRCVSSARRRTSP